MQTYFRQYYLTNVEIDAKGKIVDVLLAYPMLINK